MNDRNDFLIMPEEMYRYVYALLLEREQQTIEGSKPPSEYIMVKEAQHWLNQNQQQKDVSAIARCADALEMIVAHLAKGEK